MDEMKYEPGGGELTWRYLLGTSLRWPLMGLPDLTELSCVWWAVGDRD